MFKESLTKKEKLPEFYTLKELKDSTDGFSFGVYRDNSDVEIARVASIEDGKQYIEIYFKNKGLEVSVVEKDDKYYPKYQRVAV